MRATTLTWAGRAASGLVGLFLLFDAVIKVLRLSFAVEATTQLGYPAGAVFPIGVIELACLALYAIPRTSVLGAILLTGHLGGAVATHLRVDNPLLGFTLFPLYVAALLWGGLYLRNERLRTVVPLTR
ncbi:MAG TPA: DoxX family protein [Vicinamibacterales bacterium]|nr:DoxX family protein [Vicinamibacterales bacterium]